MRSVILFLLVAFAGSYNIVAQPTVSGAARLPSFEFLLGLAAFVLLDQRDRGVCHRLVLLVEHLQQLLKAFPNLLGARRVLLHDGRGVAGQLVGGLALVELEGGEPASGLVAPPPDLVESFGVSLVALLEFREPPLVARGGRGVEAAEQGDPRALQLAHLLVHGGEVRPRPVATPQPIQELLVQLPAARPVALGLLLYLLRHPLRERPAIEKPEDVHTSVPPDSTRYARAVQLRAR